MKKRNIFIAILAISACVFSVFAKEEFKFNKAKALSELTINSFVMEEGAAARVKTLYDESGNAVESNGLRFSAEISQEEYSALKEAGARFGVVIVAKDLLKIKDSTNLVEINEKTVFGETPNFYFSNETSGDGSKIALLHIKNPACSNVDEDSNIEICGSIVNILTDNFTRTFVGRAYVAIPKIDENGETTYSYHFAPYYNGEIANNSRCIYYVAQRAIETEAANASLLKQKYIDTFASTERFTNYVYRYYVNHHYIVHDENGNHKDIVIKTDSHYAQLNSTVEANPIEKPSGYPELEGLNFIYNVEESANTKTGLVYAGGMQVLNLYYEESATMSEDHKQQTLETIVEDFLDPAKASENFNLTMKEDGGVWEADVVKQNGVQIGISLTATSSPNKNNKVILSKEFFEELRAYGVQSITFDFHTGEGSGKEIRYNVYQEELINGQKTRLPVYDQDGNKITSDVYVHQITIYLEDVTRGGGVAIELHSSSSNNTGIYHFGNVSFGFDPKPTQN